MCIRLQRQGMIDLLADGLTMSAKNRKARSGEKNEQQRRFWNPTVHQTLVYWIKRHSIPSRLLNMLLEKIHLRRRKNNVMLVHSEKRSHLEKNCFKKLFTFPLLRHWMGSL